MQTNKNGLYVYLSDLNHNLNIADLHARLGHIGLNKLKRVIPNITSHMKLPFCAICAKSKLPRRTFPSSTSPLPPRFRTWSMDLGGPIKPQSIRGNHYYFLLVDHNTSFLSVYLLKKKDVLLELTEFIPLINTQSGQPITTIRSDNGGEFINPSISSLLRRYGIAHETTAAGTPQQNGKVERWNRTLFEMVRSLIFDSDLPTYLWDHALEYSVFIYNNIPDADGTSPYSKLFKRQLKLSKLPKFGSRVYVKTLSHLTKMESRAIPCHYIGIKPHAKAIKVYNPKNHRVFYSTDYRIDDLYKTLRQKTHCSLTNEHELFSEEQTPMAQDDVITSSGTGSITVEHKGELITPFSVPSSSSMRTNQTPTLHHNASPVGVQNHDSDTGNPSHVTQGLDPHLANTSSNNGTHIQSPLRIDTGYNVITISGQGEHHSPARQPSQVAPENTPVGQRNPTIVDSHRHYDVVTVSDNESIDSQGRPRAPKDITKVITFDHTDDAGQRRSQRARNAPVKYGFMATSATVKSDFPSKDDVKIPRTLKEAKASPEWPYWLEAMKNEYNSLVANQTWHIVPRNKIPSHKKVLTTKWVFDLKMNSDNTISRFKARLC